MLSIRGVYEVAIRVRDLSRSERFYRDLLGLTPGLRDDRRNWLFLWVGDKTGMVVLQQDPANWTVQHLAFSVAEHDLERAMVALKEHGVPVRGPVHHEWMQATSVYFPDPDGHDLELCAPVGPFPGRDERSPTYDRDSSSRTT
jgi:metallothiol transferase